MRTYTQRPTPRRARQVWDYITKERGYEPITLWKNPNCWMTPQVFGNTWGWWVAEFKCGRQFENIHPGEMKTMQDEKSR